MECCQQVVDQKADAATIGRLMEHFYEINEGIGVHKSPSLYGAFPTDPYSHTPAGKGAQQPGMTGQVKEDILSRFGELGVFVKNGQLNFSPTLLRRSEFLTSSREFHYNDLNGTAQTLAVPANALCFTYCQVPVTYQIGDQVEIIISFSDGRQQYVDGNTLDRATSDLVFKRGGEIRGIVVILTPEVLKK